MSECMYKVRPFVRNDEPLPAPSHNMYSVKPIGPAPDLSSVRLADVASRVQELMQGSKGDMMILEERQENILKKLAKLKIDIEQLRTELKRTPQGEALSQSICNSSCTPCPELGDVQDIVVIASPENPPYSILGLAHIWGASCPMLLTSHTHSSVVCAPASANIFSNPVSSTPCLKVTLVWKKYCHTVILPFLTVGTATELVINPVKHTTICGEINILRFLSRIGPRNLSYENCTNLVQVTRFDEVLDNCQQLAQTRTVKERQRLIRTFNASLGKSNWMCGQSAISVADVGVWSVLKQLDTPIPLTQTLTRWFQQCDSLLLSK